MRYAAAAGLLLLIGCATPSAEDWLARAERAVLDLKMANVLVQLDAAVSQPPEVVRRQTKPELHFDLCGCFKIWDGHSSLLVYDRNRRELGLWLNRGERRPAPNRVPEHLAATWVRVGLDPAWTIHAVWGFNRGPDLVDPFVVREATLGERTETLQEVRYLLELPRPPRYRQRLWLDVDTGLPVRREATAEDVVLSRGLLNYKERYDLESPAWRGPIHVDRTWTEIDPVTGDPK